MVILAIIGLALAYHTFSFTITESSEIIEYGGSADLSVQTGVTVSGGWHTPFGESVTIQIDTPGGSEVYFGEGYSGSFSFTTSYTSYSFIAESGLNTTVFVSGSYWAL